MPEAVRRQNNKRPMKKSFSLAAIFMAMAFVANVQTAYADRQGFNPKEPACALPAENLLDAANDNSTSRVLKWLQTQRRPIL